MAGFPWQDSMTSEAKMWADSMTSEARARLAESTVEGGGQQKQRWLLKTNPKWWSWEQQEVQSSGLTHCWSMREQNTQEMMKRMKEGELCLFYHIGTTRSEVVGIVRVVREFYPDPTDRSREFGAVDVQEVRAFKRPVTLAQMSGEEDDFKFREFAKLGRSAIRYVAVVPLDEKVLERVCEMGGEAEESGDSSDESSDGENCVKEKPRRWLLKTEPGCWSWKNQDANSGLSVWDGVRNQQAQQLMKTMNLGDLCLFYHTGKLKEVVGVVRVVRTFYPDPTDNTEKWGAVNVQKVTAFKCPVTLAHMKKNEHFKDFKMLRQPRLSVVPVEEGIWERVCELGQPEIAESDWVLTERKKGGHAKKSGAKKQAGKAEEIPTKRSKTCTGQSILLWNY